MRHSDAALNPAKAAKADPLIEAARRLISAYMAGKDLAPHIRALEAAAGFKQQEGS